MLLGRPVDACKPVLSFGQLVFSRLLRAAATSAGPCTGARWRDLPTGPCIAAACWGTGPPQVLSVGKRGAGGDRLLPARRLGLREMR
jgi:hypothetical protein